MNGERIAFENWLGIKPCGAAHDLAWAAWKARASLPAPQQATPEPVGEPWAHLWQHDETGRTKIVMADEVWTASNRWHYVGPLVLGNTRPAAAPAVPEGFALVPVEPTPEMKAEGIKVEVYSEASDSIGALTWAEVAAIYRAMLAAAQAKGADHE